MVLLKFNYCFILAHLKLNLCISICSLCGRMRESPAPQGEKPKGKTFLVTSGPAAVGPRSASGGELPLRNPSSCETSIALGSVQMETCGEWLPLTWMVPHPNISMRGMCAFTHVLRIDEEDASSHRGLNFSPLSDYLGIARRGLGVAR